MSAYLKKKRHSESWRHGYALISGDLVWNGVPYKRDTPNNIASGDRKHGRSLRRLKSDYVHIVNIDITDV